MSNRFENKFQNLPKSDIEEGVGASEFLNAGVVEQKDENDKISEFNLTDNPLESLSIEKTIKRANKTFYLDTMITKELDTVAKNNKISSSKLLEHILKEVLQLK